jgi:hypothetical protein
MLVVMFENLQAFSLSIVLLPKIRQRHTCFIYIVLLPTLNIALVLFAVSGGECKKWYQETTWLANLKKEFNS